MNDQVESLRQVVNALYHRSRPDGRLGHHLLYLDVIDTLRFAMTQPAAVTEMVNDH